ncbi:MAG: FG-GAP repeat domain-containing protein [Planctomycetota bacterium]
MADLGLVSGGYDGKVYRWPRAGAGFGPRETLVVLKDPHVACHAADWDGDGRTDVLVGARHGEVLLLRSLGARVAEPVEIAKAPAGDAGPHAADWDGDGDLDLLVGDAKGTVTLYRNAGKKLASGETLVDRALRVVEERCRTSEECAMRAKPWVADWNGDKKADLLVGDFHDHREPGREGNEHMHGWVWLYARK